MIHIYNLIYEIKLKAYTGYMLIFIHFILTYKTKIIYKSLHSKQRNTCIQITKTQGPKI